MAKKRPITAAELMAKLNSDPEYQRKREESERRRLKREQELKADQQELIAECQSAGYSIDSVWNLVNTDSAYPELVPILIRHLSKPHHPRTFEGIVRALTVREARGVATGRLIELFRCEPDPNSEIKWLLGAAIAETSTEQFVSEILELINDDAHGKGRAFLPFALLNLPKVETRPHLEQLASHPAMGESARKALAIVKR